MNPVYSTQIIRIYVVEDHVMFADGLSELASAEEEFTVVGHSSSVEDAIGSLIGAKPDVVLLDLHLPDGDGFMVHEHLIAELGSDVPKVIYVSGDDDLKSINRAMNLGAMGFLDKTGGWDEVAIAIRRSLDDTKTLGANVAIKLAEFSFAPDDDDKALSVRETEILAGIAEGLTAKEMASQMGLATSTVRTYTTRLFEKLGAKDRANAVSLGYAQGLIDN